MNEVSEELKDLLSMWKTGDLPNELAPDFFTKLEEVKNVKGLVTSEPLNFTETEYKTLMQQKRRGGSFQRTSQALARPEKKLEKEEGEDFSEFIEKTWGAARDIGMESVTKYYQRASEMGYYDHEAGEIRIRDFVRDALDWYSTYAPQVEELQENYVVERAFSSVLGDYVNVLQTRLARIMIHVKNSYPDLYSEIAPVAGMVPAEPERGGGGEQIAGRRSG